MAFSWEQRKLGELCNITTGKLDANAMVSDGQYDFYTSGIDVFKIDVAAFEGPAITIAGNGASVGYMHLADGKFNAYQRTYVLTDFLADRLFLNVAIGNELPDKIQEEVRGSGIPYIVLNMLTDLAIPFPSHEEQYAIGVYFQQLDKLITLHQRNSIGYIFKVRAYTNAWEQRKAKELFVSTADKGYPELPVLSATQDRGMIRRDENSINIFHDKKNEAGYKRVLPGQFVIHLRSFQGGFAHSAIEGITSPAYTVFGFSEPEKHDSEYWKYVFTSKSFIRRLETVTYGIRDGRSISYEEFLTLGFVYPSKAEQTAIARYLDKLSDLITLHQRERKNRLFGGKNVKQYNFSRSVLQLLRAMDTRLQRRGCSQGDYG